MKEKLTCTQCQKTWSREKTRGRKPILCPKCATQTQPEPEPETTQPESEEISAAQVYQYYHPTDKQVAQSTKGGSTWQCRCGYTYTTKFSLSAIPTHKCTENGKSIQMKRAD